MRTGSGLTRAWRLFAIAAVIVCAFDARSSAQVQVVVFEETFTKDTKDTLDVSRIFTALQNPIIVSLTNGSPGNFDIIRSGSVLVNGQPLFSRSDFKVAGTISRTVIALNGANTLDISLGGPATGQLTLKVTQTQFPPGLQFPSGTVFVSAANPVALDNLSCGGSKLSPCLTIGMGIARAGARNATQIVVGAGVYSEDVTLANGKSLLGGYDVEFTQRDLTYFHPIIRGTGAVPAAISATLITAPTVLEGFIILGPATTVPGGNSIGINIRNSTDALTVRNNLILGGVAASGASGLGGSNGLDGAAGAPGAAAISLSVPNQTVSTNVGGAGGVAGGLGGSNGGRGGSASLPSHNLQQGSGQGGQSGGGSGGSGGYDGLSAIVSSQCVVVLPTGPRDGVNGAAGSDGADGPGGSGGAGGAIVGLNWLSASGANGVPGQRGLGGGGGGAGGGLQGLQSCDDDFGGSKKIGPSGGGGGAGGAAGAGGGGGTGGGSSFGIMIVATGGDSYPKIGANEVQLGIGGNGGNGGAGGVRGSGGSGGVGGAAAIVLNGLAATGVAGNGGPGGRGGHGGGGGGGAGGNAYGIFANFDAPTYAVDNFIVTNTGRAGSGGEGGVSFVSGGQAGVPGTLAAILLTP